LTRLPLPAGGEIAPARLAASSAWFPLVGCVLGAALAGLTYVFGFVFPPSVTAALWLIFSTLITGGLHLDGLMDTADGLMGGWEPSRVLEVMRDSRIGAMGGLAAILTLLLKWTLLSAWLTLGQTPSWVAALVLMPTLGRWAMVGAIAFFPYARTGGGLGRPFAEGLKPVHLLTATVTALAAAWFTQGPHGLAIMLAAGLAALAAARVIASRIGGMTGDTYGAINEVTELTALLLMVALTRVW
jgi:adenosylcobinamide-GDP ribazoletransferase